MKKPPTTTELAQLAAQMRPEKGAEREAIKRAMILWAEADREIEQVQGRAEYLTAIHNAIYTDTPKEWKARLDGYPGDRSDIDKALMRREPADKVRRKLFKDKNLKKETLRKLLAGLVKYAKNHDMRPPPTIVRTARELPADPTLPYYNAWMPRYEENDVIAKSDSWPHDEAGVTSMHQPTMTWRNAWDCRRQGRGKRFKN